MGKLPNTWKKLETRIATYLGGQRVPVTGRQRGSAPDIEHDWLSIEVKHRRTIPAWIIDAMAQAEASQRDGQLPVTILHGHRMPVGESLVIMRLADFRDWFGGGGE